MTSNPGSSERLAGTGEGTLHGIVNGTITGTVYGTVNGIVNGSVYGTVNGNVHGSVNAATDKDINEMVTGAVPGVAVAATARAVDKSAVQTPKESNVDVLIIGAGPAGLVMASWMARCGIKTRIVDLRGTKIFNGQADALQPRTLEIFESFGIIGRVLKEANLLAEACMWNPNEKGELHCSDRVPFNPYTTDINRYYPYVLNQGRIERFLLDLIKEDNDLAVERAIRPTSLTINEAEVEDPEAYPVTVTLKHLDELAAAPSQIGYSVNGRVIRDGIFRSNLNKDELPDLSTLSVGQSGEEETVHAKYVLGSDGAHSWVREQIQCKLQGDSTDYIWGVIDIVPITDFPDIRLFTILHSVDAGSVLMVPREKNLVRLYVQLTQVERIGENVERFDRTKYNPQSILEAAQRILHPYKLNYSHLDWWTLYQVGQRVGDKFESHKRVFLAGDAVHTHSPKAGQGMNVSLQDTYNLGWKIASVVKDLSSRSILGTYQPEREKVANELIEFDHKWSRLFSGRPVKDIMVEDGISIQELLQVFAQRDMFMKGLAIDYESSSLISKQSSTNVAQSLAPGILVGKRLPSASLTRQSDSQPGHLLSILPSNGRWRILAFTGDIKSPGQTESVSALASKLSSPTSFLNKYTPSDWGYDSVFEILAIHSTPRREVNIFDFPEVFRRSDPVWGVDYGKIYAEDGGAGAGAGGGGGGNGVGEGLYTILQIAKEGCLVIVRPDQYVSYVGPLQDVEAVDTFFGAFMVEQKTKVHKMRDGEGEVVGVGNGIDRGQ